MSALATALDYIDKGWLPIPLPHRSKVPIGRAWQQLRLTRENAARHFNGARMNVGVRLGEPSGNLVDVDLDCPEALALAPRFLPPTGAIFGREGKPSSHRLYVSAVPKTVQYEDPTGAVDADGKDKATMLLELRSTGAQTVFPGSVHESGECIDWSAFDEPMPVDKLRLAGDVADLAVACLLVRAAPAEGRNAYLVDVAGALLRAHKDAASRIHHAVAQQILAELYNKDAGERLLKDTIRKLKDDEPVTGWPRLRERVGEKRCLKIAHWLGYDPSKERGEQKQPAGGREAKPEPRPIEWPDPDLSLTQSHRRPAPPLNLSVLGPFWARWIGDAAEAKGAPPDFVAMSLIAATGGMIANARRASPWPGWVEPPIVWQANVGLPSSGKSPALDAVIDLVALLERELDSDYDDRRRDDLMCRERAKAKREIWEQEVKTAIKKGFPPPEPPREIEPPPPPARRRLITNNATIEQLSRLCAANDRGLILCRDELAGWIGQMDKYGGNGADRATFIEAHGGRSCVIDRVKDGASIRVPYLSVAIIGGIQPDRLASGLLEGDDDGLTARLLFSWPEPRRPIRPRRCPDNEAALGALRWLLALAPDQADGIKMPRVLPFAPEAADRLHAWRLTVADMEAQVAGLFLSWLGKTPGVAVRIATCLELLWWSALPIGTTEPAVISDGAVAAAVSLLNDYCIPMARRTFGEAALPQADRDAIALARWLLAQPTPAEMVNARDLRHIDALPTREPGRYDAALGELAQAGWVMSAPRVPGPGRTRKDWQVNPKLKDAPHA